MFGALNTIHLWFGERFCRTTKNAD